MSSVVDGLNILNNYITDLKQIKRDYVTALRNHGSTIANDPPFMDIADEIYNIGLSTRKRFIFAEFFDFPDDTGVNGIVYKSEYMKVVTAAIFNALEARGKTVDSTRASLRGMVEYVRGDFDNFRKEPLTAEFVPVNIDTMDINVTSSEPVKYKINNGNWINLENTRVENLKDTDYITMTTSTGNYIYFGTTKLDGKVVAPTFNTVSYYPESRTLYKTKLTCPNVPTGTAKLYYSTKKMQDKYYYTERASLFGYIEFESGSEITLSERDNVCYILAVDNANRVTGTSVVYNPKIVLEAGVFTLTSEPGVEYRATQVMPNNSLDEGDKYLYKVGYYTPYYGEDLTNFGATPWNGSDIIYADDGVTLVVYETDSNNRVRKYGHVVVRSYTPSLKLVNVSSEATDVIYESKLVISTPLSNPNNSWYYNPVRGSLPEVKYGDTVPNIYTISNSPNITLEGIAPGTIYHFVEATSDKSIIGSGFVTIKSKNAYLEQLAIVPRWGSAKGTFNIDVTPARQTRNTYMIAKGNRPLHYDEYVGDIFTVWDGISDIAGYSDGEIMTLIEADAITFFAKKIGIVSAKPKPYDLAPLEVVSRIGTRDGFTRIYVTPIKETGNEYKYKIADTAVPVVLEQDVSSWLSWNGSTEISAANGKVLTLVEANNNLACKYGTVTVRSN